MHQDQSAHRNLFRVLVLGFSLVIIFLVTAGIMGVQNVRSIRRSAAGLVAEQTFTNRLIEGLQREQKTLSTVFYDLARTPDMFDPNVILAQLVESDRALHEMVRQASGRQDEAVWAELETATRAFSEEVRRLINLKQPEIVASNMLLRRHEEVISLTAKLLASGNRNATAAQMQIEGRSGQLVEQSLALLGASLLLALLCAVFTVRMSADLFRKMEQQAGELSRVSWHMLETQETTARRFSHELHDELGQCLTAVKANLLSMQAANEVDRHKLADARQLVDEAVRNVRELSQLLRPVILDDFGLDAGLRSLSEGFMDRTGVEVEYVSDFHGRLEDETETHLFRIAQEALTNVARHSGATKVWIELHSAEGKVRLLLRDNGKGLPRRVGAESAGFGMIGMRARARSAGGELRVESQKGSGVSIEIWMPLHSDRTAHDPHLVS